MAETATKKTRTKVKMEVTARMSSDDLYGYSASIPLGGVDAEQSLQLVSQFLRPLNAQLAFAHSDVRVVLYDVVKKQYLQVTYTD
jgi:hypothetical protein